MLKKIEMSLLKNINLNKKGNQLSKKSQFPYIQYKNKIKI